MALSALRDQRGIWLGGWEKVQIVPEWSPTPPPLNHPDSLAVGEPCIRILTASSFVSAAATMRLAAPVIPIAQAKEAPRPRRPLGRPGVNGRSYERRTTTGRSYANSDATSAPISVGLIKLKWDGVNTMRSPKFSVGQAVAYFPPRGVIRTAWCLPSHRRTSLRSGEVQYRITHQFEEYERVATEHDLTVLWN